MLICFTAALAVAESAATQHSSHAGSNQSALPNRITPPLTT